MRRLIALLAVLALLPAVIGPARAEVTIDITRGRIEPMPIAIVPFGGDSAKAKKLGKKVAGVVGADLEGSGLFELIDKDAFIQEDLSLGVRPRFADWRAVNAEALVQGRAKLVSGGRLRVEFRLWDVFAARQMKGLAYFTAPDNWRRVAHIVADAIYKRITGEKGYFDSRIVYIAESGSPKDRTKQLAIMDQDGANRRYLTDGGHLVLTPRFAPESQRIVYLSYAGREPRVYLFNLQTGEQERLGTFPGMTYAPRFHPDGEHVIMSLAREGNSEIYTMDLEDRTPTRLTENPAIDTSPAYGPDGERIVFNSDRGGSQQLYVMRADGSNVHRISFGDGRYASPVWSPRGDFIAFTKIKGDTFYIGVMRPDGSGERLLAKGWSVGSPTWAPNGRRLMFYRETKGGEGEANPSGLYSIDLTGHNERRLETPRDASDPAWSPLLH